MSLTTVFYNLIIYPPVQIIEIVYMVLHKIFKNPGISILGVSFVVTFLCLPLYVVAEKWQKKERETQKRLSFMTNNIKSAYNGDERFILLQEYYRQNHYHPIYALRSSFGVLIQIPFFIAAFSYLSRFEALNGVSFIFIKNLGTSDNFTKIGGLTINILPIIMTIINISSGIIYSKGFPPREKIQLFIIAGIFLVLLYNSPSGLVLYWTMNNILSFIKNIFYKIKNPLKFLYFCVSIFLGIFIIYLLLFANGAFVKRLFLSLILFSIFFIPLYIIIINYILKIWFSFLENNNKFVYFFFFSGCIILFLLTGLAIPSMVISSSPSEFSFIDNFKAPWVFFFNSMSQTAGFFLFWPVIIFFLFKSKIKIILAIIFSTLSIYSIINTFLFQGDYGTISNTLIFNSTGILSVSKFVIAANLFLLIMFIAFFLISFRYKKTFIVNSIMAIGLSFLLVFSIYNIFIIKDGYNKVLAVEKSSGGSIHQISPVFSLCKTEKNVIILMLDRAINGFVKAIFEEHPHLFEQFEGFTIYPNTVSFGGNTLMGLPPLWGGYEYSPLEIINDDSRTLIEKHNEALMVLPVLFKKSGFNVTVADQSWANYSWISDLSIYNNTDIKAFNTLKMYTNLWFMEHNTGEDNITSKKIMRNTIWFSLLKISPPFLRKFVYDESLYWSPENLGDSLVNAVNSYAVLEYLPKLTCYDSIVSSALFLTNDLTHDSIFLQYPDYTPAAKPNSKGNGKYSYLKEYHVNTAFYLLFGEYLETLKENEVYDNTRIIIVSDHGAGLDAGLNNQVTLLGERLEKWNPLLLVKDFNSRAPLKTDMTFMTNADVPFLASQGIIPGPANPFSGLPLTMEPKKNGVIITNSNLSMPYHHPNKYKFNIAENQWFKVIDDIFKPSNWIRMYN